MLKKNLILFFFTLWGIYAESINKAEIEKNLEGLLKMQGIERKEYLEKLNKEEIETLLSYIKHVYSQKDKDLEVVFQIYDVLANLKSIEISHKRLNRLLWVITITLLLFSSYVSYVLLQQNKILRHISKDLK
ncbi:MAG: hypothetical protein ACK4UJ_00805 [Leptonema sp. (in: bacteria)]